MENFELIENQLTSLGLYRPHSIISFKRFKYKYASILFLFGIYVVLMGIPMYSMRTVSQFATACFGFWAVVSLMCTCTLLMWQTPNIYALMDHFKEIIQTRLKRPDLKFRYKKLEQKSKKYVHLMEMLIVGNCLGPVLSMLIYILFIHFTRGLDTDDYRLPFPVWLPFDWKISLLGYLVAFALESFAFILAAKVGPPLLCIVVETFLVLAEFTEDIKREIATLNENCKINPNKVGVMEKFCEIIWFIARFNECIQELTNIFELLFINNFVWSLIAICDSFLLFQLELSKETIDMGVVGFAIVGAFFSFGLVFVFSEFGEQISSRSSEIDDAICKLDWENFPLHAQQMMPMILLTTQNPNKIVSYGGVLLNRDTFKKVVTTAYSYFNVFGG